MLGNADALRILPRALVDNAVKYPPAGGVVDVLVREVAAGSGPAGVEAVLGDSGPGNAGANRERVLGRFYRPGWRR